jgi:hypothetical protein
MNRLQETARHYANLAEQYRTDLLVEQELNEFLLGLADILCEELDIDLTNIIEEQISQYSRARLARVSDAISQGRARIHGQGTVAGKETALQRAKHMLRRSGEDADVEAGKVTIPSFSNSNARMPVRGDHSLAGDTLGRAVGSGNVVDAKKASTLKGIELRKSARKLSKG